MPIRSPSPTSRPAITPHTTAKSESDIPAGAATPVHASHHIADSRLAALQSIQAAQRILTPAIEPPTPDFGNLVETLVTPHYLLYGVEPLTAQQCCAFVKASTLSFHQSSRMLNRMMESMPDRTLRQSIGTLRDACAVFGEPVPVARWDVQARYKQALKLVRKEPPPAFVLTKDFEHWLFRNFAAIQAVLGVVEADHRLPDQPADRTAFMTVLAQTAQLKYAHALQDTAQQLSQMLEQHEAVFDDLAIEVQEKTLTRPSCRLAMDALNIMSLPQRNLFHVCQELEKLVQVTSESLQFLCHCNAGHANFNQRIEIIAMQTRTYSRRSKTSAALNAHRRMLNFVRLGTADLKGSVMEEMRQTLDRIEETQLQIENFNGMKGQLRSVGGQVYLALFEHVKAHSHDIEVDLRHLSARFAAADGALLMSNRLVGDMMDQIADDMHEMRHAVGEMAAIEKRRLVRTALTIEEQLRFDELLRSMFPTKPLDMIDDAEPGPSASATMGNRLKPVPGPVPDQRSLDELLAFIKIEQPATQSKRGKQRASAKKAAAGDSVRASSDGAEHSAAAADPALLSAYAEIDDSAKKLPYLKNGALLTSTWRADRVRDELAIDRERPMSATRVYRLLQAAVNVLEEKSREVGRQILIMDRAAEAVAELESDPHAKLKRSAQIVAMRSQWHSQRTELDRKAGMLRTEAANRQRMQVFKVFMAYPSLENFHLLKRDPDVVCSARRTCVRKALPEMTVTGFQKPHQDYLDVYRLKLQMKGLDGLPARNGMVEFHAHFRGTEDDALPTAAHFKNMEQAVAAGEGIHRGTVAMHDLAAVVGEIAQSAR